jgi:beta-glucan synthesis-associated protein KRE6
MASDGSLRPRRPPHITVNSGSGGNLLEGIRTDSSQSTVGTPGQPRQLLPQQRFPTSSQPRPLPGPSLYATPGVADSSEMLLAPSRARPPRPYQDNPPDSPTRSRSAMSSRRTSWSSEAGSRDSRMGPFASPFDDSRAPSRAGSDDDINTQTVSEKFNIMPSAGLLLYPEDIEKDDYLHNPDPNDKEPKCDVFSKRGFVNLGGLALITLGVLTLFIGYPLLYVSQALSHMVYKLTFQRTSLRQVTGITEKKICSEDSNCLSTSVPLLKNQRKGLIDPDTPASAMTKTAHDGKKLNLVVSLKFTKRELGTDFNSFQMNSTPMAEHFTMVMIPTFRVWISGMVLREIWNGMIQMHFQLPTERSISNSTLSKITT